MCIAAIIHSPLRQDYLNEMEKDNPHGGGIAWLATSNRGNKILRFHRGITAKQIGAMQTTGGITYPYLLHFRWATHGARGPEMAHPFPVGRRALNGQLAGHAEKVLIHNGVWYKHTNYVDLVKAPDHLIKRASDTAIAAYLVGEYPEFEEDILKDVPWATATATVKDGALSINRYGDSWTTHESDGNHYSNLNWLPAKEWFAANRGRWSTKRYSYGESSYGSYGTGVGGGSYGLYEGEQGSPYRTHYATPAKKYWNSIAKGVVTYDEDWNGFTCADGTRYRYNVTAKKYEWVPPTPAPAQNPQKWEDLVDEAVAQGLPHGTNLAQVTANKDWQDYVRARYGDEIANEMEMDNTESAAESLGDAELEALHDAGLVSDDPAEVNAYLAREYLRNAS